MTTTTTSQPLSCQMNARPSCLRWALLCYLSFAAFLWVYYAIPAEQFRGFWAGVFLLSLGLGFAFGGICLWTIWTRRHHA
jgi:hypothetical protein